MSYPPRRYEGDDGEVSARFRPVGQEPELPSATGSAIHLLATQASTGGEFGLYRMDMAPRSKGPRAHYHRTISESFFVLSGQVRLFDGDHWITGRSGDFLYVPVGGLHGFSNDFDEPASMLLLFAPGAPREDYFARLGKKARLGGEELERFRVEHDTYYTPWHDKDD